METGIPDPDDVFPCMLAMLGSGFAFMLVNKDGSFQVSEGLVRGGRTLMAMLALTIDVTSYAEFSDLASRGNPYNVHYTNVDVKAEAQDDKDSPNLYSKVSDMKEESYAYPMGKAAGKSRDAFAREDIAAALLQTACTDVCQVLEMCYQRLKFKRVFWCGSFIKAEVVRRYLTLEWRRRACFAGMMHGNCEWVTSQFLRHGPYLGALGCVINSVDQFLRPPSEVQAEKTQAAANKTNNADAESKGSVKDAAPN